MALVNIGAVVRMNYSDGEHEIAYEFCPDCVTVKCDDEDVATITTEEFGEVIVAFRTYHGSDQEE